MKLLSLFCTSNRHCNIKYIKCVTYLFFIAEAETISPTSQLSVSSLYTTSINYNFPTITSDILIGSIIASIIATNIVTVVVISSVLLYCWKGRKEKKTSVPTDSNPGVKIDFPTDNNPNAIYDEVKIDETVPTDSNPDVIYDEVKFDPITDNPAYGTY